MTGIPWLWLALAAPGLAQEPAPPTDSAPEELPLVSGPTIVTYIEAPYPEAARAAGLQAVVRLRIELNEAGEVQTVEVIEPVGHGFDEAAVDAVLAMTFAPAQTAEGPVPVIFEFEYGFVLEPETPPPGETAPAPVNLEGTIREMGTRAPIEGVQVVVDGTDLVATTDATGAFTLAGVPLGTRTIRLLHTGHVPIERELELVEGEVTVVALWLRSETYRENEVVAVYERKEEEVTRRTLVIDEVKRIPGTFGDPVKVIQTLPGAARSPFGTGLLVIRGSNPEDSGVYVDGIRIPIVYHLTGTTSILSPELIESVDYLPGGYGVQYGRSMGGVVDIKTRDDFDEQGQITWGTDILDSQVLYQGKVGKKKQHGLALGARRSYVDAFLPLVTKDTGFLIKPYYWDYQAKWVPDVGGDDDASLFLYGFQDILKLETPDDFAQGSDQDTQGDLRTQYSSHRLIGRWQHTFGETLDLDLTPSLGIDGSYFGLGQEFVLENDLWLSELRAELAWHPTPHVEIVPGTDLWAALWTFDFKSAVRYADIQDPLAEREGVGFDGRGQLLSPDVFVKANLRPLEDTDAWLITPGVRLNTVLNQTGGGIEGDEALPADFSWSLDPRVLTRAVLSDAFAVKGATGLYHQPPQPQELIGVGTRSTVGHERAWSSSIGYEHRINQAIHYDIDLFYKKMDRLILFNEAWTGFGENPFLNGGDGRAYGLEVILRHEKTGPFFGWISYTLSKAVRRDTPYCDDPRATGAEDLLGNGTCWYAFDFDQTHILSAQGGYDLPYDFGVSAQVQLVTGNPSDAYNAGVYDVDSDAYLGFYIPPGPDDPVRRLPPFFQTSVRGDKLFTFKRWQLETYVDLINIVRGVNPEFEIYNYDYSDFAYVRGLPFIPNIGLEARFWL